MSAVTKKKPVVAPVESMIRVVRGQKVMLDSDLAELYEVPTKALNQAVRRNLDRFPEDFMFQLSGEEFALMRSQIVTTSKRRLTNQPFAFTEHGVVMLSAVLNSNRAVQMSLVVVRAFVRMREMIVANKDLAVRIEKLERNHESAGSVIEVLIEDIDKLSKEIHWIKNPPVQPKRRMGFFVGNEDEE